MNITDYFIKHPVIAIVLNAMIGVIGVLSFGQLAVTEYPPIGFPTLTVKANYPNASADVVESSITNALEDGLAGLEGLIDIESTTKPGSVSLTLNFTSDTPMDRAVAATRDAVALVHLPKDVNLPTVRKKTTEDQGPPFMAISIESDNPDFGALTHYANMNLKNAFRSIPGVASADVWGQDYTFEVVLDAKLLYLFGVNADEVYKVLDDNRGSYPIGKYQDKISATMVKPLNTQEDYENLVVRPATDKAPAVYVRDVARVISKTDDSSFRIRINGKPGIIIAIKRANDANPVAVSDRVNQKLADVKASLPADMRMNMVLDQAEFVKSSIQTIRSSIIEAIILVLGIVFLFLRSFRATLIPLVTIPISLVGSMLFLSVCGFSINIITLLAMVLAIGLVVDDAIVVLENIARHIEDGLTPIAAALKGGKEISFAVIAMTFTLISVFAPIAFIDGAIGQLFIEFAVALAGSVLISGLVALTLSPLMCGHFLKSEKRTLWPGVDVFLDKITSQYERALSVLLPKTKVVLLAFIAIISIVIGLFYLVPSEMIPKEDRSLVGAWIPPIPGTNIDEQEARIIQIQQKIGDIPEAESTLLFIGNWGASLCYGLKPKSDRTRSANAVKEHIQSLINDIPSIDCYAWSEESGLPGLDGSDGSDLSMIVSTTDTYPALYDVSEKIVKTANDTKVFQSLRHDLKLNTKSYKVDLNERLLGRFNLSHSAIAKHIAIFFSGDKSLSFQKDGIRYSLSLIGKDKPWTLDELYVTTPKGDHISLGTLGTLTPTTEPDSLFHYNQMRALTLTAEVDSNRSLQENMAQLKQLADSTLPSGYKQTWTGMAKAHSESSKTMAILIVLAIVFIFAILAVQFESFIDPFIVMITVPFAAVGALLAVWAFGQSLNIYTQIGLITLIGLITKNGILIVEFANHHVGLGVAARDAIQKAAVQRLRPILMTTAAMILGAVPLILSNSSGSETRRVIGAVLVGGLGFGTALTLFLLPTLYVAIKGQGLHIKTFKSNHHQSVKV